LSEYFRHTHAFPSCIATILGLYRIKIKSQSGYIYVMACRNVFDVVHPDNSAESVPNSPYPLLSDPSCSDPTTNRHHKQEQQHQHQSAHAIAHQPPKWILYDLKGSTVGRRASPHSKVRQPTSISTSTLLRLAGIEHKSA